MREVAPAMATPSMRLVRLTPACSATRKSASRASLVEEHMAKGAKASDYYFLIGRRSRTGSRAIPASVPFRARYRRWELYWIAVDPGGPTPPAGPPVLQRASEDAGARAQAARTMFAETSTRPDYEPRRMPLLSCPGLRAPGRIPGLARRRRRARDLRQAALIRASRGA